uniref:TNFR-Cys domain-containing protein n=1 Tax=Gadus morhua TaxID=8049 RepID=A0A8C5AAL0_GADMO
MFSFNVELIFKIYLLLFVCNFTDNATASANCRPAEYSTEEGCCPTCPPGMYVSRHCNQSRSTSCASCKEGTFQDGDNGREQCFSCQHCDAGTFSLFILLSCSSTSDAVCGVLDGFFCSDSNGGGCRAAQTHTVCSPGVKPPVYYPPPSIGYTLHTLKLNLLSGPSYLRCESVGLKLMKPGTDSTDSECGEHGPHRGLERRHVTGIMPGVILVMALMALIIAIIHRKDKKR